MKPIEVEEGSETATIEEDGDDTTPHRTRDSSPETSSIGPSNHVVGASVPCDDFHTNGLERTPTPATTPSRSVTLGDFGNVDSIEQDDPGELLSQQGIGVRIMQSGCHADRDGHALLTATAGTMPTPDRVDNWVNVSCRSVDDMIGRLEM